MNFGRLGLFLNLRMGLAVLLVVSMSLPAQASSFVLGKQYLLKPKRQLSSLIWYAVTFDKSITGGLKVTLKVFSAKGQSLEYLDEYRDFVAPEIAERCISKFALATYKMDFNEQKKSELAFQVNSIGDIMYIPLKVKYENGFEDYLVRIRIKSGKFAISTRPLQHGMLTPPAENAVENFRAEQAQKKEQKKKQEEAKKAKLEAEKKKQEEAEAKRLKAEQEKAIKNSPSISINDELFSPEAEDLDQLLKESESKFEKKEAEAQSLIKSDEDLYSEPLQTAPEHAPKEEMPASEIIELNNKKESEADPEMGEAMDALFKEGGAASDTPQKTQPIENQNPFGDEFDTPESNTKDTKKPSNKKEKAKSKPVVDDDEIEIEGFDKALEELERLEGLEGL